MKVECECGETVTLLREGEEVVGRVAECVRINGTQVEGNCPGCARKVKAHLSALGEFVSDVREEGEVIG